MGTHRQARLRSSSRSTGPSSSCAATAHYSDFLWDLAFEDRGSEPVMHAVIKGIVWGDDPATTCALLLKDLTGDGRLWASVGSAR